MGADHGDVGISALLFHGAPGSGPGPHRHPYDEIQCIQSGRGRWTVEGQTFEAGAGDILVIKAGEVHGFTAWRARGETLAHCRRATEAELAGVPAHMRQEVVCEGERLAAYRLFVVIDGRPVLSEVAPGSGVAGDRPIYVLREFALAPGRHQLQVRFTRDSADAGEGAEDGRTESPDTRRPRRQAVPPLLRLDTTVVVPEHAVLLVTYDSDGRRLVLRGGAPDP
ncbi:MAG TPA: cupin domain-containing protein [Gemmatimonadaceae bacterium]|nr:cupin domain-containing protein [Gemmatimonadaceae bacterium]